MQKSLVVIGLTLALSLAPLVARAADTKPLIGTPCEATHVGMTRMDTDQENTIACLKAGTAYQWKSMVGSGGANCGNVPNMSICAVPATGFQEGGGITIKNGNLATLYQCDNGTMRAIVAFDANIVLNYGGSSMGGAFPTYFPFLSCY